MKATAKTTLITLLLAGFASAPAAMAQELTCDDIEFKPVVTDQFPRAPEACLGVVERNGQKFAKFTAQVVRVRSGGELMLKFKRPDGSYGDTIGVRPPMNFRAEIDGTPTSVRNMRAGQDINIYMPGDRWEIAQVEEGVEVVMIKIYAPEPEPVVEEPLPTTAGPLPLFALIGLGFLAIGAGLTAVRRISTR